MLDLHVNRMQNSDQQNAEQIDIQFLRKYIHYARLKCSPRMDQPASIAL